MLDLVILNFILIAIISVIVFLQKYVKSNKTRNIILLCVALSTILCHYSSLIYHHFLDNTALAYLKSNPNLILPIYPCNVVMWSCLIFSLCRNKQSIFCKFLIDYIFWFGIASTLVGMFANVDFIRDPNLLNYDVTKGIIAHAIMLLNVLLLPRYGYVKINLNKSIIHIIIAIVLMLLIGLYCNLVFKVLVSDETAYNVNSMFLLHSPIEGISFLTYPYISIVALILYFDVFAICELFAYKKGYRWFNRISNYIKNKSKK